MEIAVKVGKINAVQIQRVLDVAQAAWATAPTASPPGSVHVAEAIKYINAADGDSLAALAQGTKPHERRAAQIYQRLSIAPILVKEAKGETLTEHEQQRVLSAAGYATHAAAASDASAARGTWAERKALVGADVNSLPVQVGKAWRFRMPDGEIGAASFGSKKAATAAADAHYAMLIAANGQKRHQLLQKLELLPASWIKEMGGVYDLAGG
jgi:hypothetical protein